jgi:hypothetical protein
VVELRKQIQNNLNSFQTPIDIRRNVYAPDKVELPVTKAGDIPVLDILPPPKQYVEPIETPPQPPIFVEAPTFEEPTPIPVYNKPIDVDYLGNNSSGGGGGYVENDFGLGYGKENIIERDMNQRQNLQ